MGLELMSMGRVDLEGVDEVPHLVGSEIRDKYGNQAIHVTIDPWQHAN